MISLNGLTLKEIDNTNLEITITFPVDYFSFLFKIKKRRFP